MIADAFLQAEARGHTETGGEINPRCRKTETRNRAASPNANEKSVPPFSWNSCWHRSGVMLFINDAVSDGSSTFVANGRM